MKKILEWSKDILEKSLKFSMFKNDDSNKIDKIMYELVSRDAIKDHSRNLSAKKCEEIGLKIKILENDKELQDLVLSIHHACISYFNHEKACKIFSNQLGTSIIVFTQ